MPAMTGELREYQTVIESTDKSVYVHSSQQVNTGEA